MDGWPLHQSIWGEILERQWKGGGNGGRWAAPTHSPATAISEFPPSIQATNHSAHTVGAKAPHPGGGGAARRPAPAHGAAPTTPTSCRTTPVDAPTSSHRLNQTDGQGYGDRGDRSGRSVASAIAATVHGEWWRVDGGRGSRRRGSGR
jgi:hypothetical protein